MLNLVEKHQAYIKDFQVLKYIHEFNTYSCNALITFHNDSMLLIKEYRFENLERSYAFHWKTKDGSLIIRWDNAPQWPNISTFPHHKHMGETNIVEPSTEINLEQVMEHIIRTIRL